MIIYDILGNYLDFSSNNEMFQHLSGSAGFHYILPDVARGAYFHGRDVSFTMKHFLKYTHHSILSFYRACVEHANVFRGK